MDWNANLRGLVSRPPGPDTSFNFLYNYNYDQLPGMEVKHPSAVGEAYHPGGMEKLEYYMGSSQQEMRKKRMTSEQLESLERSFQEEVKLDPDRKMKLSRELGLQPRQIAIWFQNRRARWKAKQLERLYDALKMEFDAVSKEKQKLQDEVIKLKAMLRDEASRKPLSMGYTDISGEETVESTSVAIRSCSGRLPRGNSHHHHPNIAECNYNILPVDEYNHVPSPYWPLPVLPTYPS